MKSANTKKNFDELISKLSEKGILSIYAMSSVKGGGDDGNGSVPIVIPPIPPLK